MVESWWLSKHLLSEVIKVEPLFLQLLGYILLMSYFRNLFLFRFLRLVWLVRRFLLGGMLGCLLIDTSSQSFFIIRLYDNDFVLNIKTLTWGYLSAFSRLSVLSLQLFVNVTVTCSRGIPHRGCRCLFWRRCILKDLLGSLLVLKLRWTPAGC